MEPRKVCDIVLICVSILLTVVSLRLAIDNNYMRAIMEDPHHCVSVCVEQLETMEEHACAQ